MRIFFYHTYFVYRRLFNCSQIESTILRLAKQHPDLIQVQNLGNTYQGKIMNLVKISKNFNARNPIIFIDAGKVVIGLFLVN